MVKNTFTKLVVVKFVDGEIKGAHDATWIDIMREIAMCTGEELEVLCDMIEAECTRRAELIRKAERTKAERATEAEEEIALDAMYD